MTWSAYLPGWPLEVSPALWLALTLVVAVLVGEVLVRHLKLPRIVGYIGIGLLLGPGGLALIPQVPATEWRLVVDLALGILLFELGSKVNLRWLKANPWIAATSLLEASATFVVVFWLLKWFDVPAITAAVVATIVIATSPAIVVRTVTESRAQGQVTDRLMLMTALNCSYAVIFHKFAVAAMYGETGASLIHTVMPPLYVLGGSALLAVLFGVTFERLHHHLGHHEETFSFVLFGMIAFATIMAATLKLSPILVLLAAGLITRYRRKRTHTFPPHFGSAGAVLVVLMFIANGLAGDLGGFGYSLLLVLLLITVRAIAKLLAVLALANQSGIGLRQATALGLALIPMSSVPLLLTMDTATAFPAFGSGLGLVLMSCIVILELAGPIVVQMALKITGETPDKKI
ncbi:cation:proton antiporter [Nitrosospira briensis]|uniref:Kef-type K+ transport system, membrane component KefB n=1 Tax=Nitrosospira briensis TaxID=35799 RepID=A0A1I4YS77_9PROT|nr:cation:proton antiporter [Nitrosospira briensis]SFN40470.1 Kef-type K+ transport system, membrane component KefB [Nitrosospira briensis]SFN75665.1 transporter, CPA2 family [Nitrosospira briensis]